MAYLLLELHPASISPTMLSTETAMKKKTPRSRLRTTRSCPMGIVSQTTKLGTKTSSGAT